MTKLEEVERAMFRAYFGHDGNTNAPYENRAEWFSVLARAAVEALREPSEYMAENCRKAAVVGTSEENKTMFRYVNGEIWRDMIDAILNEPEEFDYAQDIAEKIPPTETPDPERIRRALKEGK